MPKLLKDDCGSKRCRAYVMTTREFERLTLGEKWDQSFRSKFGKRAVGLYVEIYGHRPGRTRKSTMPSDRNKVHKYPCGVLEEAYRQLKSGESTQEAKAPAPVPTPPAEISPATVGVNEPRKHSGTEQAPA